MRKTLMFYCVIRGTIDKGERDLAITEKQPLLYRF